jgi:hypothetical protein
MSKPRPLNLPVVGGHVTAPDWVRGEGAPEVEPLLERLNREESSQPLVIPKAPRAARETPLEKPRKPKREAPRRQEPEAADLDLDAERRPPRANRAISLGSLVPGGRSIVPPPMHDLPNLQGDGHAQAFADAVTELGIARAAVLSTVEGDLLDLSLAIASAIVETEVQLNPELHLTLVRSALRALGDCTRARLRTSPEAFKTIVSRMGAESFEMSGVDVQLVADASIPGLGCVIDEEQVRVDATVAERLRSVRIAFEDERRRRPAGGVE